MCSNPVVEEQVSYHPTSWRVREPHILLTEQTHLDNDSKDIIIILMCALIASAHTGLSLGVFNSGGVDLQCININGGNRPFTRPGSAVSWDVKQTGYDSFTPDAPAKDRPSRYGDTVTEVHLRGGRNLDFKTTLRPSHSFLTEHWRHTSRAADSPPLSLAGVAPSGARVAKFRGRHGRGDAAQAVNPCTCDCTVVRTWLPYT
ncbi:hypothetical protein RRG08_062598 [Elysia crispata]|uniref:Uncharacterized protein n=1 Tax=Elysia crispata TaxID=231223 RepID=A0AAE1D6S3_9GAST|nr:hypothetical protein RRG08_062598 [Elysia crispata]